MDDDTASQDNPTGQDLTPYEGRWVALAGGQVAGVGDTAMAAERLGRRNRLRERLSVYFVEANGGPSLALPDQLQELRPLFRSHDQPVHLVGGAVRDVLLGRKVEDLDFVVPNGAIRLAFKVADILNTPAYVLDRERDTGRVILPDGETTLDFACYRGTDLRDDLQSRDFTINAMALPVAARRQTSLIDPCAGQSDLKARLIRLTHPLAIEEDPVRAMRAVRHAVDLGFEIEGSTRKAIRKSADQLNDVSVERIRDELLKMLCASAPESAIRALSALDLLAVVLPEVATLTGTPQTPPHFEFAFAHTLSVMANLAGLERLIAADQPPGEIQLAEANEILAAHKPLLCEHLERRLDGGVSGSQVLQLGALLHDVGKAQTMTVETNGRIRFFGHAEYGAELAAQRLASMHLSREAVRQVKHIVGGHMRPLLLAQTRKVSRRAVYRFFRDTEEAGLDITLLALADQLALARSGKIIPQWHRLLEVVAQLHHHYFAHHDEMIKPAALLDGRDVMEILGINPGPKVGWFLGQLVEAQAAGEVVTKDEAVNLVINLAANDGELTTNQ